jgi:hypothetical protein
VVYLGLLAIGGSYVLTRFGLADLEAGYRVDHRQGHVGDDLRTTYSISNASGLPKPWLEVYNPTDLPVPLPGRALGLRSWAQRSWIAIVPLTRRGPSASSRWSSDRRSVRLLRGGGDRRPADGRDRLPARRAAAALAPAQRLPRGHALRPGADAPDDAAGHDRPAVRPGDSFNRIHWRSTARLGEIQVKEFDLEQTADLWLFVDLERGPGRRG